MGQGASGFRVHVKKGLRWLRRRGKLVLNHIKSQKYAIKKTELLLVLTVVSPSQHEVPRQGAPSATLHPLNGCARGTHAKIKQKNKVLHLNQNDNKTVRSPFLPASTADFHRGTIHETDGRSIGSVVPNLPPSLPTTPLSREMSNTTA